MTKTPYKTIFFLLFLVFFCSFSSVFAEDISTINNFTGDNNYHTDATGPNIPATDNNGKTIRQAWYYKVLTDITADTLKFGIKYTAIDDATGDAIIPQPETCPVWYAGADELLIYLIPTETINISDFTFHQDDYSGSSIVGVPYIYKAYSTPIFNIHTGGCDYNLTKELEFNSEDPYGGLGFLPATTITAGQYLVVLASKPVFYSSDETIDAVLTGSNNPNIERWIYGDSFVSLHESLEIPDSGLENLPNLDFYINAITAGSGSGTTTACNMFSGDISTAFLNTEFSLGSCLTELAEDLFIPSSFITGMYTDLIDTIGTKPPFGWINGIYQILPTINIATATPAFTLEQVTPIVDTIFNPIRTGLAWLLCFAFAFMIFNRFKDITL